MFGGMISGGTVVMHTAKKGINKMDQNPPMK